MNQLVSFIVPVYNVEKYLPACVESIINQTYNNIEVILIDDGSTDNSSSICDYYERIDNRIKVIHKKNGGVSDARNFGLASCCGEIIAFVDSDDWIEVNFVRRLYSIMVQENADIVTCTFKAEGQKVPKKYKEISVDNGSRFTRRF